MELWYEQPAKNWEEALPVGNGRLGAMIAGSPDQETIWLNEDSIWSGKPLNRINPDAKKYLPYIREMIRQGNIANAESLSLKALAGTPNSERAYQSAGELYIKFKNGGEWHNYRRALDLNKGISTVQYVVDGTKYKREMFASFPEQVMVLHMKAEGKGTLDFCCHLERCHNRTDEVWAQENTIGFVVDGGKGISFSVQLAVYTDEGDVYPIGEHLLVEGAKEAVIYINIETSFREKKFKEVCREKISRAAEQEWEKCRDTHVKDFIEISERMRLTLGAENQQKADLTSTDKRLEAIKNGEEDPALYALYFQYGRYLLLSSSRGNSLPANLQGIWNNSLTPPWDSKFTININTEMNYWLAESGNLSECHLPYFNFLKRLCENGRKTAWEMYGCKGSVAHHNSDIYADTAPQDFYIPASFWVMGEAWLATHIWEHFEYTGDKKFLKEHFEILQACVEFFTDFMIRADDLTLVTSPSVSPENTYIMKDGRQGCMCEGAVMDVEILMELLEGYKKACEVLRKPEKYRQQAEEILKALPPLKIGKYGQLQEWQEDYEEAEPGHRHISHLYGVYPGHSVSWKKTPKLMQAAEVTLKRRLAAGGGHTGWSRAWIIGLWAHFRSGQKVYENLQALLSGSTFPNLMDNHPMLDGYVFQIDGNLGAAAAMIEMLVQCEDDCIWLLPALPDEFSEGKAEGVRLRNGLLLSMEWKNRKVTNWKIKKDRGCDLRDKFIVYVNGEQKEVIPGK
ncbi:glycoside hydrolase family 95 protein [Blautia sp. Sow4_E7]|uniref:glycoside hydrolase family 95 protein n=1 Tax=Blautia sp. Sow4_E7 TaxID=3438749 RepID=UPI003F93E697